MNIYGGLPYFLYDTVGLATVAQMTNATVSTSNAYSVRGRLQEYGFFEVKFEISIYGRTNALYFFFGGDYVPQNNTDLLSRAFFVSFEDPDVVQMTMGYSFDLIVNKASTFNLVKNVWIPVTIQYIRNGVDHSFTVAVSVYESLVLKAENVNADWWSSSTSGSFWGIGAQNDKFAGSFSFKLLDVDTGATYCGAGILSSCATGTYSLEVGSDTCVACPIGSYSSREGATSDASCSACLPGTYSNIMGKDLTKLNKHRLMQL